MPARSVTLSDCHIPKLAQTVQCATLEVPENRDRADSRRIGLSIVVLPANTLSPRPDPLFILAGGPGQSASSIADFAALLSDVRTTRDIVLVDQRGTGRSAPLDCKAFEPERDLADALETDPLPKAKACVAELASRGVDLTQYTTAATIADLEDVRRALAYPRVNLWGGSYGTRVAQEYLRAHPEVVRSVVLDGVATPSMVITLDVWPSRERALRAVVDGCAASPACKAAHPRLGDALADLRAALGEGREVTLQMPRTGETRSIRVTFDAVVAALQPVVYQPETAAMLPEIIGRARAGDFAPLAAMMSSFDDKAFDTLNAALHYSVTCTEDVPRITPERRAAALKDLSSAPVVDDIIRVCSVWPRGKFPSQAVTPVTSDVPVLLLSGGLDPVTPPSNAEAVAKTLSHARSIVAPGVGHIVSSRACAPRLIGQFVDAAGFDKLSSSCVDFLAATRPPLLWPDRMGPRP